jgi:protein TonB
LPNRAAPPAPPAASGPRVGVPLRPEPVVWFPGVELADRGNRILFSALIVSIAIHMMLLAIRFRPFDLKPMLDRGPPLEVALVNAKSKAKPAKADVLAQANLDGGGNTDAQRRAKTPLPPLAKSSPEQEIALATQRVDAIERQAKELLTRVNGAASVPPPPTPAPAAPAAETPSPAELMQRTLESMRLEAQIAKETETGQQGPKRKVVRAHAEEYRYARYVEDWRLKVERVGNLNYPEAARQLRLYGSLLLFVSIRSDGSVEKVEVRRSSGQRVLDAAAVKIVEMAAPFAPFPPDIRRETDILDIERMWTFTRGDEVRSE